MKLWIALALFAVLLATAFAAQVQDEAMAMGEDDSALLETASRRSMLNEISRVSVCVQSSLFLAPQALALRMPFELIVDSLFFCCHRMIVFLTVLSNSLFLVMAFLFFAL